MTAFDPSGAIHLLLVDLRFDLGSSAMLALVYVAEGFRRVPSGAVVFRRALWGEWKLEEQREAEARWTLVSWFPPFTTAVVVPVLEDTTAERLRLLRQTPVERGLLLANATAILLTLVIGLPAAAASRGALGFLAAVAALVMLCIVQAVNAAWLLERRNPWRVRVRRIASLLSPFRAPRVIELLLDTRLAPMGPVKAARLLLVRPAFAAYVRPRAFDAIAGADDPELRSVVSVARYPALTGPPESGNAAYCPRCGATYIDHTPACAECDVPLARTTS